MPRTPPPHAPTVRSVLEVSCPSGGTLENFLEPYLARPQLVVVGRSPTARTLTRLASVVGFRSCGIHPDAQREDFPDADHIVTSLDLSSAGIGGDSWVVVATMGHYDAEALEAVLRTDSAYVGLVASRRRRNAVVQTLRQRGWSGDALAGIVNPAGSTLADAPEEIALSIMADIVDRRNRRQTRMAPAAGNPDVCHGSGVRDGGRDRGRAFPERRRLLLLCRLQGGIRAGA